MADGPFTKIAEQLWNEPYARSALTTELLERAIQLTKRATSQLYRQHLADNHEEDYQPTDAEVEFILVELLKERA
jgi:hypothetical protein